MSAGVPEATNAQYQLVWLCTTFLLSTNLVIVAVTIRATYKMETAVGSLFTMLFINDLILALCLISVESHGLIKGILPASQGTACQIAAMGVISYVVSTISALALITVAGRSLVDTRLRIDPLKSSGKTTMYYRLLRTCLYVTQRYRAASVGIPLLCGILWALIYQQLGFLGWFQGGLYCSVTSFANLGSTVPMLVFFVIAFLFIGANTRTIHTELRNLTTQIKQQRLEASTQEQLQTFEKSHQKLSIYWALVSRFCFVFSLEWGLPFCCAIVAASGVNYPIWLDVIGMATIKMSCMATAIIFYWLRSKQRKDNKRPQSSEPIQVGDFEEGRRLAGATALDVEQGYCTRGLSTGGFPKTPCNSDLYSGEEKECVQEVSFAGSVLDVSYKMFPALSTSPEASKVVFSGDDLGGFGGHTALRPHAAGKTALPTPTPVVSQIGAVENLPHSSGRTTVQPDGPPYQQREKQSWQQRN